MYSLLLFAHITGAMVLSAAVVMDTVNVLLMMRARDVASLQSALATHRVVGVLV